VSAHLIHIGYPKTGTSLLRRWFAAHPQVEYIEGGIAGFRTVYDIATHAAGRRTGILYRVTSCEALATPHPSVGKPVVDYARIDPKVMVRNQAEVADSLGALFPTAAVLVVTRGFRSMIMSSYSQLVRTGGEIDFQSYCESLGDWASSGESVWDYNRIIDVYADRFREGNVIVMPYELLREDVNAFIRVLEERLGLRHSPAPNARINPSLSPVELRWYPSLTRVVRALPVGAQLRRRVELYVRGAEGKRLRAAIGVLQRLNRLTPVTVDMLPEAVVESFRGKADRLRDHPLYARYGAEYLF
jgi:hypothetical protein